MPTKMSLISSRAIYMGCRWPSFCRFPGMVTSRASAFSRASRRISSSFFFWVSISAARRSRTSLASWPITGRSSAESLPICFKTAVSSPFLPKYFTRRASSSALSLVAVSAAKASCLIFSSCSFILYPPIFVRKKALPPSNGTKGKTSAVPPEFRAEAARTSFLPSNGGPTAGVFPRRGSRANQTRSDPGRLPACGRPSLRPSLRYFPLHRVFACMQPKATYSWIFLLYHRKA